VCNATQPVETGLLRKAKSKRSTPCVISENYRLFFLWRFFLRRFLRLWVAILWRLRFFPDGIVLE
jgi:hypothetical protein